MELNPLKTSFKSIRDTLGKPMTIYSVLTILFAFYLVLRTFGVDIVPPLLSKIGVWTSRNTAIQIEGNYIYESCGMDSAHLGYYHGGFVHIEQTIDPYGIKFGLAGYRTWRKFKNKPKEHITFPWSSDWGGVFEGKKIRFTYNIITTDGEKIKGYIEGDIHCDKDGKSEEILGNFNQLPPANPMYGSIILRRIDKDEISKGDVYELVPVNDQQVTMQIQ